MFDQNELSAKILGNPATTQYLFLTEIESRTNGEYSIADPNNALCLLGEFGSSMTAQFIKQEDRKFDSLYSKRAKTPEDLYAKLSDYTYVNLTASPASCKFIALFNKDLIISEATRYDDIYDAHIIPKETIITIAGLPFTLYYPILILVNRKTNIITVEYDVTNLDKLKTMSTNLPYQVTERTINGITYLAIVFEAYQFTREVYTETVDSSTGYYTSFTYSDLFYAAKVESYNASTDTWSELQYSLSKQNYDITTPTAILVFDNDQNKIDVRIPQIYFSSGSIGSAIRTTIYSTKGTIDVTISQQDMDDTKIDFMPSASSYASALSRSKDYIVTTYDTTRIEGGSTPPDFATIKEAVTNQTIYDTTPITKLQLKSAVSKYGFTLIEHLDNLVDSRIYYAGATLTDSSDNSLIPVVASKVILADPIESSTILTQSDGTLTILPTTIFKYDRVGNSSRPLNDQEIYALSQMTSENLIDLLNSEIYTRQPYHIWLDRNSQYPTAKTYNLSEPKMTSLTLQKENIHSTVMMNVVSIQIEHLNDGTGGYRFYIYVERSPSLPVSEISNCKLLLQTTSRSGSFLTFEATYSATGSDGSDIYTFDLPTTYRLYSDGYIQISVNDYTSTNVSTDIPLTSTWILKTLVNRSVTDNSEDDADLNTDVPYSYTNNYLVTSKQTVTIELGESLEDIIFNQVSTTWGDIVYEKYTNDVPYTYDRDIYLTDRKGYLLTKVITDASGNKSISMVKLFNKGDEVLSKGETAYTVSADVLSGNKDITLGDTTGILIGQMVSGTSIYPATVVLGVEGKVVSLSNPVMNDIKAGSELIFASTYIDTVTTQSSAKGTDVLTIGNTTDIVEGMTVAGFGIAADTVVKAIGDGVITLSSPLTDDVNQNDTIAIYYKDGARALQYKAGDTVLDGKGNPVSTGTRTNTYGVMMIQFDARLYESEDPNDISFVNNLPSTLKAKAAALDPIREQLLEQTFIYYLPFRTIGDATYGIGDGKQITMPLEMSYTVTYYVSEATKSDLNVQSVITTSTLNTINSYVQNGSISTNELGYNLKTLFSGLVDSVSISGVDNGSTTNLVIDTTGASPSIEKRLSINGAGKKYLSPNVTISFQVSPS